MEEADAKSPWVKVLHSPFGVRVLIALIGLFCGGGAVRALGDAGGSDTARTIADSTVKAHLAPVFQQLHRQDTALMRIFFRQDVQMSDGQKFRADSMMRAALQNINYGSHE